jgi:hypothetical protein
MVSTKFSSRFRKEDGPTVRYVISGFLIALSGVVVIIVLEGIYEGSFPGRNRGRILRTFHPLFFWIYAAFLLWAACRITCYAIAEIRYARRMQQKRRTI